MPHRFGPFVADRISYRVSKGAEVLDLTPKLLDLLFYLVERPAVLVTKEELLQGVWPDANVTDNALAQAVSDLRTALGDHASAPTYIRTVARRGYRFIAPVESSDAATPARTSAPPPVERSIAVLDFQNVTGDPDVAWLAAGIAETVTTDLSSLDGFTVVDRWRVLEAVRRTTGSLSEVGAAVGANLAVSGSYQRSGPHLRITARLVDLAGGEAVADAKVDGPLDHVFELQDGIVVTFAREMGLAAGSTTARLGVRETSNLDAFRAYTEGLLKLESLDTGVIQEAIADFKRAIAHDSGYAMAYTGLANAEFVAYEMTRASRTIDRGTLEAGIGHARRAVELEDQLGEAHATLSFLLVSAGRFEEARAAARKAVWLEPENWRHQYRLGHALWGAPRLRALDRALAMHPQFAYAMLEIAMTYIARGDLVAAERVVRRALDEQSSQAGVHRFPAAGFHWMLGALEAAGGRFEGAIVEFERELDPGRLSRLYGPEYGALACVGRGHALASLRRPHEALASFRAGYGLMPEFARAMAGEAMAQAALGNRDQAASAWSRVEQARAEFAASGRANDALELAAISAALRGRPEEAVASLNTWLNALPACRIGWHIPVEPAFASLREHAGFAAVLARLGERAT